MLKVMTFALAAVTIASAPALAQQPADCRVGLAAGINVYNT